MLLGEMRDIGVEIGLDLYNGIVVQHTRFTTVLFYIEHMRR
jgi:hypothetical protein